MSNSPLPVIAHAGLLEDATRTHPCVLPDGTDTAPRHLSCSYCGVGDGAQLAQQTEPPAAPTPLPEGPVNLLVRVDGQSQCHPAVVAGGA